jgi:hypothetical protein
MNFQNLENFRNKFYRIVTIDYSPIHFCGELWRCFTLAPCVPSKANLHVRVRILQQAV